MRVVYSVEIVEEFVSEAEPRLRENGYLAVEIWPATGREAGQNMRYDKILVTAAADEPPAALLQQLKQGGRMVLPMGADEAQVLTVIHKGCRWGCACARLDFRCGSRLEHQQEVRGAANDAIKVRPQEGAASPTQTRRAHCIRRPGRAGSGV